LAPVIRDLTTFLTDLTNKLNSMDEGTKKSIVAFLAVVAAIGPVLLVIGKLIAGIGQVIFWFGKIQAAWPAIVGAFGAIKGAIIAASGTVSAFLGPIALLIGSLAFMITRIKECGMTWEDFVDGMVFLWNDAVAFVKQLVEDIIYVYDDLTGKAFHWGFDLIKNFVEGILSNVPSLRSAVNNIADEIASRIHFSSPDVGPLADFPRYMPDMLKELATGINANIGLLDKPMNNLASAMVPTNGMGDKLDGIKGAIGNMNTNVNVTLEGDAQGLFRMVKTQNGKAKRMTGRSAFA
ncbi:MAG: hypothetical protein KBT03_04450, partial [Bacteroidales bacterium]|nr:hypothetical protein [Candidatus Scybalousia scybalohippi]